MFKAEVGRRDASKELYKICSRYFTKRNISLLYNNLLNNFDITARNNKTSLYIEVNSWGYTIIFYKNSKSENLNTKDLKIL
jgi:hypothetical protein